MSEVQERPRTLGELHQEIIYAEASGRTNDSPEFVYGQSQENRDRQAVQYFFDVAKARFTAGILSRCPSKKLGFYVGGPVDSPDRKHGRIFDLLGLKWMNPNLSFAEYGRPGLLDHDRFGDVYAGFVQWARANGLYVTWNHVSGEYRDKLYKLCVTSS